MKIKAISIYQPWASLIAVGAKKYETRSWAPSYRGPLLICAAKGGIPKIDVRILLLGPEFYEALSRVIPKCGGVEILPHLPFGQAVAIVDLTKITKTENCFLKQMQGALPFGDFSPGRYAWKLENVRAIEPFPVKGRQGLFEVEIPDNLLNGK